MNDIVKNPVLEVYEHWETYIRTIVGNNYSMEWSTKVEELPWALLFLMGTPTRQADLEGHEIATNISFQTEAYANGRNALTDAYKIDEVSHQAMIDLGFTRTFGPELIRNNNNPLTRRVVSRYSRIYTGFFNAD